MSLVAVPGVASAVDAQPTGGISSLVGLKRTSSLTISTGEKLRVRFEVADMPAQLINLVYEDSVGRYFEATWRGNAYTGEISREISEPFAKGAVTLRYAYVRTAVTEQTQVYYYVGNSTPQPYPFGLVPRPFVIQEGALDFKYGERTQWYKTPDPYITGTANAGLVLTAKMRPWVPTPQTVDYQWYRDDQLVDDGFRYTVSADDIGRNVTVRATAHFAGLPDVTRTSAAIVPAVGDFPTPQAPTITGQLKVGTLATAKTGTWATVPVKFTYQWMVAGKNVAGATKKTFTPRPGDVGKRLQVRVTAAYPGYNTLTRTSASSIVIAP